MTSNEEADSDDDGDDDAIMAVWMAIVKVMVLGHLDT